MQSSYHRKQFTKSFVPITVNETLNRINSHLNIVINHTVSRNIVSFSVGFMVTNERQIELFTLKDEFINS